MELDWDLKLRLLRAAVKLIIRTYRAFRVDYLRANIVVAAGDPMLTGVVFGALTPLLHLNRFPGTVITLSSDFTVAIPTVELSASLSARPLRLMGILLVTALTLPWLRLYHAQRVQRLEEPALSGGGRHG